MRCSHKVPPSLARRRILAIYALQVALGSTVPGCPRGKTIEPAARKDGGVAVVADAVAPVVLPPAPPLPAVPKGLDAATVEARLATYGKVTPEAVALGELLFFDPRLSASGKLACATCHDPAHGFSGTGRQDAADGKPNLRRAPPLVNLVFATELGWDGRYASLDDLMAAHVKGQLGDPLATSVARLADVPGYRAYFARVADGPPTPEVAQAALNAFVVTRYAGGSTWDLRERDPNVPADLKAGYQLFTGKARCAACHVPPLYTDLGYHRLGLIASHDDGRGRVDPGQRGAFKTPTVRGAAARLAFFHDASAQSLEAAIDWHLAGGTGQGADRSIVDPELRRVVLSPAERTALRAFVEALAEEQPTARPTLP